MTIASSRHFSKLVQDYVGNFDSSAIKTFFPCSPFAEADAVEAIIKRRLEEQRSPERTGLREALIARITETHQQANAMTPYVKKNLELLAGKDCLAVVTGQQVGICAGPLYTIYKALHTVALARTFNARYPAYQFVPVFWQETEDHDFAEVSSVTLLDNNFDLKHIVYQPEEPPGRKQVGTMKFESEAIKRFFEEITSALPSTDFTNDVLALYERCYHPGATFADAQASLLGELLADEGLLVVNANSRPLKSFATAIFEHEITTAPELSESIQRKSESLRAQYHAQIDAQGANLFLVGNGNRYKLQREGDSFRYDDKIISATELLAVLHAEPERMSMNVVLRPIVQDTILPTAAYVAGPGEIAYFTQLGTAYDWAGIQMPMIMPRISLTIVEDRFEKLAEKHQTSLEALIEFDGDLVRELLKSSREDEIGETFDVSSGTIEAALEQLRNVVESADPSLGGALTTIKGKMLTQLKDFSGKALAAERKKNSMSKEKFMKALNALLPDGKLQERELNLLYFLNKYGFSFWNSLKVYVLTNDLSLKEHHLIHVSELLASVEKTA
ncbi:MAG TPA: bacillithiol biosynthesis cysteine-adding enzyme BshC [Candidatus Kapabacteria bacterium]|nr:bacillithiol biosynthesis cysteine-adding enzyme BshC [Candidatus Kapabacteria bacterium]